MREPPFNFLPLKIEFRMQTPIALAHPWIHLEGIVAHLWQRRMNRDYRAMPSKRVVKITSRYKLPIKRFFLNGQFIYHASISLFDTKKMYVTTIYKRFYEKALDYRKVRVKKISRGSGYFKDFAMNLVYIPAKKVTFYANADPDVLEMLFEALPALGKKTAIGFGFIKDFKIEELDEDYSIVWDGIAMRPIPYFMLKSYEELVMLAYKTPFWAKENVTLCAPPFTKVELKRGESDGQGVERVLSTVV